MKPLGYEKPAFAIAVAIGARNGKAARKGE